MLVVGGEGARRQWPEIVWEQFQEQNEFLRLFALCTLK